MSQGGPPKPKPKRRDELRDEKRRNFLKLFAVIGGVTATASVAPWTEFLLSSIIKGTEEGRQKILLPDGRLASVDSVPTNSSATFVYPRSGDPIADAEPFRRFQLIRLNPELGGNADDATAFRAYSMICVHLWCLWDYYSDRIPKNENIAGSIECPCHGSKYSPFNGLAVEGPASMQTAPNNALPSLSLEVDSDGALWVLPPVWNVNENGVVGFGRYVKR